MSHAETIAALKIGKERIARGWCKGNWAQDRNGHRVDSASAYAARFCVLGALVDGPIMADRYLDRVADMLGWAQVTAFNDASGTELRHVLDLYDWAIALAESDDRDSRGDGR